MQCALGASTLGSWRSSPTSLELRLPILLEASNAWVRVLLFWDLLYIRHVNIGALCTDTELDFLFLFYLLFSLVFFSSHGRESLREVAGPLHGHHEAKHSKLRGAAQELVWK